MTALDTLDTLARELSTHHDTTALRQSIGEAVTGLSSIAKDLDVAAAALALAGTLCTEAAEHSRDGMRAGANAQRDELMAYAKTLASLASRMIG